MNLDNYTPHRVTSDAVILFVPKGSSWQPPEGCEPIKVSQYYALKEEVTA